MIRLRLSSISAVALAVAALASVASLAGCGKSVALSDLDKELVNATCDYYVRCGIVQDHKTCVSFATATPAALAQARADVDSGALHYDESAAADCIDAIAGQSCNPGDQDRRVEPGACNDTFKGNRKDGEACFDSGECASRRCTLPQTCTMACCIGSCTALPAPAAIGQSCTNGVPCVDGAYCNTTGGTTTGPVCAALLGAGVQCQNDAQCTWGLQCMGGSCQKPPAVGAGCIAGDCGVDGHVCAEGSSTCEKLLFEGAICDPANNLCAAYLTCDTTARKCVAGPAVGQPCPTGVCGPGGFCKLDLTGSVCTAPQANGQTCTGNRECASGACAQGKCADPTVCH
jgi:Dickkopf N-terminal cysteine-rich region